MRDNSVHTWRALSIFLYFIFITLMRDFVSRVHLRGENNILTISRSHSRQNLFFGFKKKKNEKRITSFYNGLVWYIGGFLRSNVCLGNVRPGANSCYSWRAAILSINPLLLQIMWCELNTLFLYFQWVVQCLENTLVFSLVGKRSIAKAAFEIE